MYARSILTVLVSLLAVGCGANLGQAPAGLPIATNIPEGIYLGDITWSTRSWLNGVLLEDLTEVEPYQEVVDENGLPLIQPGGETPVENLVLTRNDGVVASTMRVESVNASGNRLFVTFTGTVEYEGVVFSRRGTWTYEYFPPNELGFTHQETWLSEASEFGDILSFELLGQAVISR